ncbi:hypothetical protein DEH84_13855 [Aquabacterium olei]|uniref:Glycosyl transferase n=1 Tax=Aquabacterium olei TaxID=1296669 RepID=A0A2U8FU54_9BURK|nr:hypothetical protein [Aquabacterium olei]AWI54387.1 hypothetical protein DEH84_13855 [Aquabacterium olei]
MPDNSKVPIAIIAKEVNEALISFVSTRLRAPIHVVTPERSYTKVRDVKLHRDDDFLPSREFFAKCVHPRPGWIYQQCLKYQVVLTLGYESLLILDGDSVIADRKFLDAGAVYYTPRNIEAVYDAYVRNVLGTEFSRAESFITNQMLFNRSLLVGMLDSRFGGVDKWVDHALAMLDAGEFSEYQVYACWALLKGGVRAMPMKVFRRLDLVRRTPLEALQKYDLVAFEPHHRGGSLREVRARFLYALGRNLG